MTDLELAMEMAKGFATGVTILGLAIAGYYIYQWWLLRQEDKRDEEDDLFR